MECDRSHNKQHDAIMLTACRKAEALVGMFFSIVEIVLLKLISDEQS